MHVHTNLVHQQLWKSVTCHEKNGLEYLTGFPPQKLHPDDQEIKLEHVIMQKSDSLTKTSEIAHAFQTLDVNRLLLALVSDDSTCVYYLVHKGLQVPRRN